MHRFQLSGLSYDQFAPFFDMSEEQLLSRGLKRYLATANFGFPCRVSLEDAAIGDELLLLPFEHQAAASPYRASGPIFVRRNAEHRRLPAGIVPPYVSQRLMSLRAYDADHLMVDATVCEGAVVAEELARMFAAPETSYVHLHNAKRGCFSCLASRVA